MVTLYFLRLSCIFSLFLNVQLSLMWQIIVGRKKSLLKKGRKFIIFFFLPQKSETLTSIIMHFSNHFNISLILLYEYFNWGLALGTQCISHMKQKYIYRHSISTRIILISMHCGFLEKISFLNPQNGHSWFIQLIRYRQNTI